MPRVVKKCPHGKQPSYCQECGGSSLCLHGRAKYYCVPCKGKGTCEHSRIRKSCKDCGTGSAFCSHGNWKATCKECGGASLCIHGVQKYYCVPCEGTGTCQHGRIRKSCKDCGGSAICSHGRQRNNCVECLGCGICVHLKQRSTCRECATNTFCEHGGRRYDCVQCRGGGICIHLKQRYVCAECNGTGLCSHGIRKDTCRTCHGSAICPHNKRKQFCAECHGSRACRNNSLAMCGHIGNRKYDLYCTHCFSNLFPDDPRTAGIRSNSKEIKWVNALLQSEVTAPYDWTWDKPFYVSFNGGCCNTKRRIDLWTMIGHTIVAIEIDEDQHKKYAGEDARYNDLMMDFTGRYIFLRINPDPFKLNGKKQDPPFDERLQQAEQKLDELLTELTENEPKQEDALVQVHHMFYDC